MLKKRKGAIPGIFIYAIKSKIITTLFKIVAFISLILVIIVFMVIASIGGDNDGAGGADSSIISSSGGTMAGGGTVEDLPPALQEIYKQLEGITDPVERFKKMQELGLTYSMEQYGLGGTGCAVTAGFAVGGVFAGSTTTDDLVERALASDEYVALKVDDNGNAVEITGWNRKNVGSTPVLGDKTTQINVGTTAGIAIVNGDSHATYQTGNGTTIQNGASGSQINSNGSGIYERNGNASAQSNGSTIMLVKKSDIGWK